MTNNLERLRGFSLADRAVAETMREEIGATPKNKDLDEILLLDANGIPWLLHLSGTKDPRRGPRERFAFLLGAPFVNIADVIALDQAAAQFLVAQGVESAREHSYLIRVASSYPTDALVWKDLDSAVAGELIFSLWVRRRDAHHGNHGYNKDGIPVCFDFAVAFLNDANGPTLDEFFREDRRGWDGYAVEWKVAVTANPATLRTENVRAEHRKHGSLHLVKSLEGFSACCRDMGRKIETDDRCYDDLCRLAGMQDEERIKTVEFLNEGKESIGADVEHLLQRVFN